MHSEMKLGQIIIPRVGKNMYYCYIYILEHNVRHTDAPIAFTMKDKIVLSHFHCNKR